MTITQAITELLGHDKRVAIPRFGTLTSHTEQAKVNVVTNHFTPPCSKITFAPDNDLQDDTLAAYLSKKSNISIEEAAAEVNEFADTCNRDLKNLNKVVFGDLGTLTLKYDGSHEFELDEAHNFNDDAFGLPQYHQSPIIRIDRDNDHSDDDKIRKTRNGHDEDATVSTATGAVVEGKEPVQNDTAANEADTNNDSDTEPNKTPETTESEDESAPKTESETTESVSKPEAEEDEEEKKHPVWPWILLLLLILCAGFVALTYFELIPNYIPQIIKPKNKAGIAIGGEPRPYYHYEYTELEDTTTFMLPFPEAMTRYNDSIQRIADSLNAASTDTIAEATIDTPAITSAAETTTEVTATPTGNAKTEPTPVAEAKTPSEQYLIVCGCFSVEENAEKRATQLRDSGYPNAFAKKRGSMWNVYYDKYTDKQEAKQALDEIRANVNPKAWLLETKK